MPKNKVVKKNTLDNLSQEQFDHLINLLILYKQMNPKKNVYLNEKSIHEALNMMKTTGKNFADQLGMSTE